MFLYIKIEKSLFYVNNYFNLFVIVDNFKFYNIVLFDILIDILYDLLKEMEIKLNF